ncbi:MAG: hypothetical protein H8E37_06725 [Planctomycetes bacterium]|nr:hypothetical protein [Planctomycetota bacterium]
MMYTLGQVLPVGMVGGGVILILLSEGEGANSGFAIAGALLIGAAYLGLSWAGRSNSGQNPQP